MQWYIIIKILIYLKGGVAFNKYNTNGKYIGIPPKVKIPEERLVNVSETIIELAEGIYLVPNIKLYDHSDTHFDHFIVGDGEPLSMVEYGWM